MDAAKSRLLLLLLFFTFATIGGMAEPAPVQLSEFIFGDEAPFPSCHASTLESLPDGTLLAAWFGGSDEGEPDVEIWMARKPPGGTWSVPVAMTDYPEDPCWNPVLFRSREGTLWLFFKVGPSPQSWVGGYRKSVDEGRSWSAAEFLPAGLLGPIKNKPIELKGGEILSGTSVEAGRGDRSEGLQPYWSWTGWVERSSDQGKNWEISGPIAVPGVNFGVIQPTLWEMDSGGIRMLLRATRQIGFVCESISHDQGRTWSPARPTRLPNPNSGLDAVKLRDGRVVLIYNHTESGRSPLNLAVSLDDGESWQEPYTLETEPGEYSYPAVIQSEDGSIHVSYTWKREKIKYVVIDPRELDR